MSTSHSINSKDPNKLYSCIYLQKRLFNNYTHKAVFRLQIRKQSMFVVTEIIVLQLRIKYLMSLACFWTHPLNVHRIRLRRTGCRRRSYWSSDQIQFRGHRRRAIKWFLELSCQWKVVLPWPGQQWQEPREWGQTWWRPFWAVGWSNLSSKRLEMQVDLEDETVLLIYFSGTRVFCSRASRKFVFQFWMLIWFGVPPRLVSDQNICCYCRR